MVYTTAVACAMAVVHCTRFGQCGIFDLIIIRSNHTMRKVLLSLFCLALSLLSAAQPEAGKVYNLKNVSKGSSLGITNLLKVIGVTTNEDDLSQQWYVESVSGAAFSLRNMCSGLYLQGHNAASNAWTLVPAKVDLEYTSVSDAFAVRQSGHSNGYAYLHIDGSGNAVSWSYSNDSNTLWQFNEVKYTEEELNKALSLAGSMNVAEETVNKYQSALDALFADKACSQLKVMCTESEMKANADYLALPATLQQMVLKVLKGSWEESNGDPSKSKWDSDYARKYRVQLYEPYNEPEAGAKALRINAHTNLNNPTGIYSAAQSLMYVMVEGEIKDGASLYLASYTGHGKLGGYTEGVELKSGLNVVPAYSSNSNYCINYVVHTFDTSDGKSGKAACKRRLSDYPALKIHIEGGHINGYYNKVGDALYSPDKNADWDYLAARATQTDLTVLGKYITLQFPLNDADTEGNKGMAYYFNERVKIEDAINEWDNVMMWERLLMGVMDEATIKANALKSPYSSAPYVIDHIGNNGDAYACDYGDYYNVHGLSFGVGGNSYMYGSWDHCGYHYSTMSGVIESLPTNAGSHWGPGHEIGHQHQGPLNMRGLTEVTNNLFSNVVLWYYGESTSRYNGDEGALSNVLKAFNTQGSDFFTNNIWAQTHMYYKLFLYYHVLGKNPKFYPVLFEMLRQDPMTIEYEQSGAKSLLHFYKKCCMASGEDLTEFFRAHGFFRVMKDRFVGDYSNANYNMTQEEIDAAIAEIKALKYPENIAVLFINDATGETIKSHKGDNLDFYGESTICADLGSYASFATAAVPEYTYSLSVQSMTMQGTGGIGFVVVNERGELLSFSDRKSFEVSLECAKQILLGNAKVMAVDASGALAEARNSLKITDQEGCYAQLGELLELAGELFSMMDNTGNTRPGFYVASAMTTFMQVYTNAQDVYDNREMESYCAAYENLFQVYCAALNDRVNRVPFVPGSTYVLTNYKYSGKSIGIDDSGKLVSGNTDLGLETQQWFLEPAAEEDTYYIKNTSTQKYLGALGKSAQVSADASSISSAMPYKLYCLDNGLWALQCQTDNDQMSLHMDGSQKIVGWTHTATDNDGSWWYLTATSVDEDELVIAELSALLEKSEILLAQVGSVAEQYISMSTEAGSAFRLTDNNGKSEGSLANLLDGRTDTYYVSNWTNSVTASPYLQVEAAEGYKLCNFSVTYTTRNGGGAPVPATIEISASTNGTDYVSLQTFKKDTDALPVASNAESWTSPMLGNKEAEYRYVRFTVTEGYRSSSSNNSNGICHFGISEFGINNINFDIQPRYASINESLLLSFHNVIQETRQTMLSAQSTQEYIDAYNALDTQYKAFLAAKDEVENAELEAEKTQLLTLINKTTALIDKCGKVKYVPSLQTSDENSAGYLSTNAPEAKEGKLENLLDGEGTTYFHSAWSADVNEVHYLMIDMGDVDVLESFTFSYQSNKGPFPYKIAVYGSTEENGTFELFKTFSKDDAVNPLPAVANKEWTSEPIRPSCSYRYLRFDVTKSGADGLNANPMGEYCFVMSEFALAPSGCYSVKAEEIGEVTEHLLLETYLQNQKAKAMYDNAVVGTDLDAAASTLQSAYDALFDAAYANYSVDVVIGSAGYASFYTPVALALPEGLEAYAVESVQDNMAKMEAKDDIAASQGTILKGESGTYTLTIGKATSDWSANMLRGTATDTYIEGSAYVLSLQNGVVGFYKAMLNKDANGNAGTTHFLNNAGKAYLPVTDTNEARFLVFNFGEDTETAIDELKGEKGNLKAEVYDLAGRRVQNAQKGVFIVNGKVVIK